MKKILIIAACMYLLSTFSFIDAQVAFNRGVNLTGWFQTSSPRQIQFTKYTKQDFENIKSLGCDVIRLPINLFYMTDGKPSYTIDTLFLEFLDAVVDWAEELNIYLILDNHSTDDIASKNPDLESVLTIVWAKMAQHFKNRSTYVLYEIMNEPNGISTQTWGNIQQSAIDAIRSVDTTHTLVVGPSSYNSYNDLSLLPAYTDKKLIYTFHFYEPFIFTHQGATWSNPSLAPLTGVPFPYNVDSMPTIPEALKGTWIESSFNNYGQDGTVVKVHELIDKAIAFKNSRNVPVYCGEFGVYMPYSKNTDRVHWYGEVRKYLEANGISWTTWDYQGEFGLFSGSNELFDYDLNIPLIDSLGLNVPSQQVFEIKPDSTGFDIYTDFIGAKIYESSNASGGIIDFYSGEKPNNGNYCLHWNGSAQYGSVGFNFTPYKDLSKLVSENYALSGIIRGMAPGTKVELRFIDTKTGDPDDHPWRMDYIVDDNVVTWDGKWHKIYVPLSNFFEQGSWDGAWFNPVGAFDWHAVDRFELVAEQVSLADKHLWFDNMVVTDQDTATIYDTSTYVIPEVPSAITTLDFIDFGIYPNPVNNRTTIAFSLQKTENINVSIYNISGQKIKTLLTGKHEAGNYSLLWNADSDNRILVVDGIYVCKIHTSKGTIASIISVLRK